VPNRSGEAQMPLSILLLCISEYRLAVTIARNIDYVSNGAPRMLIYPLNEHDQIDRRLNFRVGYMPPQPSVYKCPNRARRHSLRTPWGSESSTNKEPRMANISPPVQRIKDDRPPFLLEQTILSAYQWARTLRLRPASY
jgi:hypothetical protein